MAGGGSAECRSCNPMTGGAPWLATEKALPGGQLRRRENVFPKGKNRERSCPLGNPACPKAWAPDPRSAMLHDVQADAPLTSSWVSDWKTELTPMMKGVGVLRTSSS